MINSSGFKTAIFGLAGILLLLEGAAKAAIPQAAGSVFQQSATDGLVVIEAENAGGNIPQGGHTWDLVATPAGFVGAGAMSSNPNSGLGVNTDYVTGSPRLDFRVLFNTTGTHYVWVRGRALMPDPGNNDSCHTGLNNAAVASADRLSGWGDAWTWRNNTMDNVRATITVATTGIHTVNLWMREDGFLADRILLTTNAGYAGVTEGGTMAGPAQSAEIAVAVPGTPALSAVGATAQITLSWGAVTNADTYTLVRSDTPGGPYNTTVATGLTGTSYVDLSVTTGQFYYYVLYGVNTLFGQGPPSNEASAEAISLPRYNDHEEGTSDGSCACGSAGFSDGSVLWTLLAAAGLLLGRRKPR